MFVSYYLIDIVKIKHSDFDLLLLRTVPFNVSYCIPLPVAVFPLHCVCCCSHLGAVTVVSLRWDSRAQDRTGGERGAVHGAEQDS